jgi:hypothetical protein
MNKIVPDPPRINPSDHPLFFYPTDLHERDGNVPNRTRSALIQASH